MNRILMTRKAAGAGRRPILCPRRALAGLAAAAAGGWLVVAAPWSAADAADASAEFRWGAVDEQSLGLWEGAQPVLVYNHGVRRKAGVPADRARSTYVHPIYGLDGEVLTDDFPKDHYHHRGLFWAWPHVEVGGKESSLWDLRGIEQRWVKWLRRDTRPGCAVLGVENGWFVGDRQVLREEFWCRVGRATAESRGLDVELTLVPLEQPVVLRGAEGKSYGGLTLRFAPGKATAITTSQGRGKADLAMTRLTWADLSARFANRESGAAIFIAPDHPDYPPTWLTRHYGVLCVGWPGVKALTLPAGRPAICRYRLWLHRGRLDPEQLEKAYDRYAAEAADTWK
ncbi:MAG: PmoA family protein [Verrucomicrobia bacterium]|nr:PmoA family protein [Verrucomicrobiota bacterium]